MTLSIEYENVQERCSHCGSDFDVVRGPVFDGTDGIGLYLVGLHHCDGESRQVIMTIAFRHEGAHESATLQVWPEPEEIQMVFIDTDLSPWAGEDYLGRQLTADEARESSLRASVFEVADMVCETIPEVVRYLGGAE